MQLLERQKIKLLKNESTVTIFILWKDHNKYRVKLFHIGILEYLGQIFKNQKIAVFLKHEVRFTNLLHKHPELTWNRIVVTLLWPDVKVTVKLSDFLTLKAQRWFVLSYGCCCCWYRIIIFQFPNMDLYVIAYVLVFTGGISCALHTVTPKRLVLLTGANLSVFETVFLDRTQVYDYKSFEYYCPLYTDLKLYCRKEDLLYTNCVYLYWTSQRCHNTSSPYDFRWQAGVLQSKEAWWATAESSVTFLHAWQAL